MPSRGGEARAFNTMVTPKEQPEESRKEGLSVEEKVMIWAHGKLSPNKKGWGKGRKSTPRKWGTEWAWLYQDGKDARAVVLEHMSKIGPDVEEEKETDLESEEESIRKWTKERAIRTMGPKEEGGTKIESEGSGEMQDTQMSGLAWEEEKQD